MCTFDLRVVSDYVFGDHKFGGNAQSIVKDRWLHHTSFLWDIDPVLMSTLKQPQKQPEYRKVKNEFVLQKNIIVCLRTDHMKISYVI